jgi:hypothetical protein
MASVDDTARRLAVLLTGNRTEVWDPAGGELVFRPDIEIHPLARRPPPADVWAVDGGQALVADARTVAVYVTRVATVRWCDGRCVREDEGPLQCHLLGGGEGRAALAASGAPVAADATPDVNLLRDWAEWRAVAAAVDEADAGAVVLVDGDLQPDWRIPSAWLAALMGRAAERGVTLAGVTKHSSLARGGAPLVGWLEAQAETALGPRTTWWAPVARTRPDVAPGIEVVVARLDPDARFAFRVDLPASAPAAEVLGAVSALCDDAAFPGYPYPLSVADRLAACPGWLRDDVWAQLQEGFWAAGVPTDVAERAFSDRHRLMERS